MEQAVKKRKSKIPSLQEAIKGSIIKGEKKKSSKDKFPVIDEPEMREHVDLHVEARAWKKKAEAEISLHGKAMAEHVLPIMDTNGYAGKFASTYVMMGNTHQVKVIFENKFTINADDEDTIRGLLGDGFDDLIEVRQTVKLKKEVLEDEDLANELMALVGRRWNDFFESDEQLVAKPDFKEKVYQYVNRDQMDVLRLYVKQWFPSIK